MQNKKYIIPLIWTLCMGGTAVSAQTLAGAQKLFGEGKFAEAKPTFQRLVKQAPSNANYNFWYGACCYETGAATEAIPYLQKSAKRKIADAYLYLGKICYEQYRFDEAVQNLEEGISLLDQKKKDTSEAEALAAHYRQAARMIRGVENITVIDSFAVSKQDFLKAYKLSKESGEISTTGEGDCTEFTTEMGDKRILARPAAGDKGSKLYSSTKLINEWSTPEPLKGVNDAGTSLNYPFLNSDGITLYYAAKGGESMGGYDLFITRYDPDEDTYLRPDNMGFPFNSPYNDYMYAIDDFNGLGWFASDRYQPEGKVCVYVFVPNESKVVYDYDTTDSTQVIAAATLRSIRATWNDADKVRQAKQQLAQVMYGKEEKAKKSEFTFVVNDHAVYHSQADFRSKEALKIFLTLRQKEKDLAQLDKALEADRRKYQQAANDVKKQMAPGMLDKERRSDELRTEIRQLQTTVRNTEITAIQRK